MILYIKCILVFSEAKPRKQKDQLLYRNEIFSITWQGFL